VFETNRGGQATFHGPGQLVGYPVLDLSRRGRDLHRYLRFLEDLLIGLSATYGVTAQNREGLTGVWVGPRKLASLGVGVRKWVSMHGFAINITRESTEAFAHITPCGLTGVEMTSLAHESGSAIPLEDALARTVDLFMQRIDHLTDSRTL
jgi:lipoyl(octanoyl) transferase